MFGEIWYLLFDAILNKVHSRHSISPPPPPKVITSRPGTFPHRVLLHPSPTIATNSLPITTYPPRGFSSLIKTMMIQYRSLGKRVKKKKRGGQS